MHPKVVLEVGTGGYRLSHKGFGSVNSRKKSTTYLCASLFILGHFDDKTGLHPFQLDLTALVCACPIYRPSWGLQPLTNNAPRCLSLYSVFMQR